MSLFGKNIKKIRSVKSLSQQAFAEIFDLKRGTLGAYEEGRSEPKIETIIKIANYFSIPIGDMLTKELTVNQLLKFKVDFESSVLEKNNDLFIKIPCITPQLQTDYLRHHDNPNFIADLPYLNLPVTNENELRAFVVDNLEMSSDNDGLYPKDIIIGERVARKRFPDLQNSCIYLLILKDRILLRRVFQASKKFILKADHRGIDELEIDHTEVKELWELKYVFYHRVPEKRNTDIKEKLSFLETEFQKLRSSLDN